MRFMMLMIPDVYRDNKELSVDFSPHVDAVAAMMKYNEELANAGVLVSLDGLHPLTTGARVSYADGTAKVTDGPFIEAKEVLGGYWLLNVKSKEEAVEWAKKVPAEKGDVVEIRQVFEFEEFPEDVQKVADSSTVRDAINR